MLLKIDERFFNCFVNGSKIYEVRKSEKGITSGMHKFSNLENIKLLGNAWLEPIFIISKNKGIDMSLDFKRDLENNYGIHLDDETLNFVIDRYLGVFDFTIYEVSQVKPSLFSEFVDKIIKEVK